MVAFLLVAVLAQANPDAEGLSWQGTWRGELRNYPARPGAKVVEVQMDLGAWPESAGACTPWKTTYREEGQVKGVKDYKLCRGAGAGEYYVDEGNGIQLPARLLDGALVSQFKYGKTLLSTVLELRDGVLEERIFTANDTAASEGVVTMPVRSLQKLTLRRAVSSQKP